jgi:hypothetical protein
MPGEVVTTYRFTFADGTQRNFAVRLRPPAMDLVPEPLREEPEWIRLDFRQCPNCPLSASDRRHCPVARNLVAVNEAFCHRVSFDEVDIVVADSERSYRKTCALQEAASSLMGLIMATSGCPHLDKLRPMVYTHLPFSTSQQTTYRAVSMYLLAQFFRQRRGLPPDWKLRGLARTYAEIHAVNQAFAKRLAGVQRKDANLNAIVGLDAHAGVASFSIADEEWGELEAIFHPYLADAADDGLTQRTMREVPSALC